MKAATLVLTCGAVLLMAVSTTMAKNPVPPQIGGGVCIQDCTGQDPLPAELEAEVIYVREEEKLARDVYLAMADIWNIRIFDNISAAEQKHMDAVLKLIDCYGLVDPVVDDTPGVFTNPDLQALYTELVTAGSVSLLDALYVGATIEEMDISDLQVTLAMSENADVNRVFENLLCATENHLRAFAKQIDRFGGDYVAQFLPQEEFDAIADSPAEPCGSGFKTADQNGFRHGNAQQIQYKGGATLQK